MRQIIGGLSLILAGTFVSCGSSTSSENSSDTAVTGELTPGQRLDTAIADTRESAEQASGKVETAAEGVKEDINEAANKTKDGIGNAYEKTREGVKEAGRDIKDAANDTKEKVKEGTAKAAEKVEQRSKEIKEDMRKK